MGQLFDKPVTPLLLRNSMILLKMRFLKEFLVMSTHKGVREYALGLFGPKWLQLKQVTTVFTLRICFILMRQRKL